MPTRVILNINASETNGFFTAWIATKVKHLQTCARHGNSFSKLTDPRRLTLCPHDDRRGSFHLIKAHQKAHTHPPLLSAFSRKAWFITKNLGQYHATQTQKDLDRTLIQHRLRILRRLLPRHQLDLKFCHRLIGYEMVDG